MMKTESGRSMVEMLGVLAIIGVLSIGGIAGYTMAMNKYRANENLATGSQCVILAQSDNGGEGITVNSTENCGSSGYKLNVRSGITMTVERTDTDAYTLHIGQEDEDVCQQMHNAFPSGSNPYTLDCPS